MAARHRDPYARRLRVAPWLIALLVAGLLTGGTAVGLRLTSDTTGAEADATAGATVTPTAGAPSAAGSGRPEAERSAESTRAARGADRSAVPSPSPSPSTASTASTASAPSAPSTTSGSPSVAATVVDSGTCGASYYASGQVTANGEAFDPDGLTAAHRSLPFDTRVRVSNPATGAAVVVRINDRGPFVDGRCLDLSRAAFAKIAALDLGHLDVRYEVLAGNS
ncbi:septal ring lytic transglycosylase RlpA family protein [Solwaraspora sp. WMMB335]|uniref:septal ring lytic transglycosylase RlpA family protein n=1 Tax=Solwaraspora sp. WMMB335 TaxID=3404118 RepID=UPI003B948F1F